MFLPNQKSFLPNFTEMSEFKIECRSEFLWSPKFKFNFFSVDKFNELKEKFEPTSEIQKKNFRITLKTNFFFNQQW